MSQITSITTLRRDPQRASIKVDGKRAATLNFKLINELGLSVGQHWDDQLAQRVEDAAAYDKAWRAAMRRLDRRAMSKRQLINKLERLTFDQPTIQRVIDQLTELGLLDDVAFGRALIREIQRGKPAGPRLLAAKLRQKGLDASLIAQLLADEQARHEPSNDHHHGHESMACDQQGGDYTTRARQLAEKKLPSLMRFDAMTRKRRLWGMLARRGFEPQTIEEALEGVREALEP